MMEEILKMVKENNKILKSLVDMMIVQEEIVPSDIDDVHEQELAHQEQKKAGFDAFKQGFIKDMKERAAKYDNKVKVSPKQMKWVDKFADELKGIEFSEWED